MTECSRKPEDDLRGYVEVRESWGEEIAPYRYLTVYYVYDWTRHRDSAAIVGSFDTRTKAIEFARDSAEAHERDLATAEVIPLRRESGAA